MEKNKQKNAPASKTTNRGLLFTGSDAVDYIEAFNSNNDGELELTLNERDYIDLKLWQAEKEISRLLERMTEK